jgi:hypothetical protein
VVYSDVLTARENLLVGCRVPGHVDGEKVVGGRMKGAPTALAGF